MRNMLRAAAIGCALLAGVAIAPIVVDALAQTATTTTTTEPVTISVGTYAGQAITWIWATLSAPIGAAVIWLIARMAQGVGIALTEQRKTQLQGLIVNGINFAVAKGAHLADGKLNLTVTSPFMVRVIGYVQQHGGALLKALGVDPNSQEFRDAIAARVAKALNDPATPTPPPVTPAAAGGTAPDSVTSPERNAGIG